MRPVFLLMATFALLFPAGLRGQGKNKIPYENFDWAIYYSDHFKVFYYSAEKHLLEDIVDKAEAAYKHVSKKLQHELNFPVPLVVYKTHEEFEQTNVFSGFLPRFVGAFAEPFQSRMVLPVDLAPQELYALLTHELTHIFQYDMLYNNKISTILRSTAPIWFIEGMASYVADDESNLDKMYLRDVAVNGGFGSLGAFSGLSYVAYRVGNAAFRYIEDQYGIEGIRNFLWQYRKNITGSITSAIERAFETEVEDFDRDFRKYLRRRYINLLPIKEEPDDFAREIRTRKTINTLSPELSPSGDLFAAIVPIKNELDLVLVSTKDGRIFKNLTKGITNRYTEINVGSFNGINDLAWTSDGNELAFTARKEGTNRIFVTNVLNGKMTENLVFSDIRDAQSPVFSKDGKKLFFVGNSKGVYDIFSYDRESKNVVNLTQDEFHNRNPRVSPDGNEVLYSSRRDGFYKIFTINLASGAKQQLTSGLGNDIQATYSTDMKSIYFSSDRFDDIYNIYELELDSGLKKQYTDILTGAFSPQERVFFDHKEGLEKRQLVFTAYYQGRFRIYRMDKPEEREEIYDVAKDNFSNVKNYKMTANIELDPERFKPYKIAGNFSLSGANVNVGATDDGRFISNSAISLSDTLGNHVLDVSTYNISGRDSYYAAYLNRSNRWQWGGIFSSEQDFFVSPFDPQRTRQTRTYKSNQLVGIVRYPISLYSRFDVGLGVSDQDSFRYTFVRFDEELNDNLFDVVSADYTEPFVSASFSRDSVRYQSYGPQQGMLFTIGYSKTLNQNDNYTMDFRAYRELTRRSLIAFRTLANRSDGETPSFYALGGNNNLRGDYRYQEFIGSRRFLAQLELRFPLIDYLRFPGFAFDNIRGSLFIEAGGTWFDDDLFNFEFQDSAPGDAVPGDPRFFNADNPNVNYLIGAMGAEISMNLFGLEVHWTWAQRTNFDDIPSNSRMSFWIGRKF